MGGLRVTFSRKAAAGLSLTIAVFAFVSILSFTGFSADPANAEPSDPAWFDTSYNYRYEIKSTATSASQVIAVEFGPYLLWTKNATAANGETRWLYCDVSECGDGRFTVGNETHELPWELDNMTGYLPREVYKESGNNVVAKFNFAFINSSGKLYDSSQNNFAGFSLIGTAANATGIFDKAVNLTASYYIGTSFPSIGDAFTIALWANVSTTDYSITRGLVEFRKNNGIVIYGVDTDGNGYYYLYDGGWTHKCTFAPTAGVQFLVFDDDGTNAHMYRNGSLVCQFPVGSNAAINGVDYIGSAWGGSNNYGWLDEMTIWNRSLSNQEIMDLYYNGAGTLVSLGPEEVFFNETEQVETLETRVAELENRTTALETRMAESENRTTVLEGAVSALGSVVDGLANLLNDSINSLNYSINRIRSYLTYLPRTTRRTMICGTMIANNETAAIDLGLSCHVDYTPDTPRCTCVPV